jgi:hypothetical protein
MGEESPATDQPLESLESLNLPSMTPRALVAHFGPGLILMMTGIGTSHLVTAPTAGGRFAYALLWCIPLSYVFKYYGFEMAFRFTNASGKGLLEAYATAWKKWPLWYVMITTLLQCAIGQAGRLIAAAATTLWPEAGRGCRLRFRPCANYTRTLSQPSLPVGDSRRSRVPWAVGSSPITTWPRAAPGLWN